MDASSRYHIYIMSEQFGGQKFSSPEEEIAYLRERIAARERELLSRSGEVDHADYETIARAELREYAEHPPETVLEKSHRMEPPLVAGYAEQIGTSRDKVEEIIEIAETHGIRNTFSVLERINDSFLLDEAHRALIAHIRVGKRIAEFKEGMPLWNVLHMTLFSVALPELSRDGKEEEDLNKIISAMEQLYAGLGSLRDAHTREPIHYSLEVAVSDKSDDIVFYVAVPSAYIDLFEKQVLSLFPHAVVHEEQNDYNIFVEGGTSLVSTGRLGRHGIYPIRTYDTFDHDPLRVLLNAFSKIEREGGGASLQVLVRPKTAEKYHDTYLTIVKKITNGMSIEKAIETSTFMGSMYHTMRDEFFSGGKEKKDPHDLSERDPMKRAPQEVLDLFKKKIERPIHDVNIRIAVSARDRVRAQQILAEIEAGFNQFENTLGNRITFSRAEGRRSKEVMRQFSFREFDPKSSLPLSHREIATLIHFPRGSKELAPQFRQTQAVTFRRKERSLARTTIGM
jgi:hypothetical protein